MGITDYTGIVGGPGHADQPNVARATVVVAPQSPTDIMEVALVGYSTQYTYEVPAGNWAPRGRTLPAVGAACVVCFDHPTGDAWVPMWEGVEAPSDMADVGDVKMTLSPVAPPGWLMCNGQAVSRQTYAALFPLIGISQGAGDGSTTFNLPNYKDRMPVGAGGLYPLGSTGGEAAHVLAKTEMPPHNHAGFTGTGSTGTGTTASTYKTGTAIGLGTSDPTNTDHYHAININSGNDSPDHGHTGYTDGPGWNTGQGYNVFTGYPNQGYNFVAVTYNAAYVGGDGNKWNDFNHTHNVTTYGASARHAHNVAGNTNWQSQQYATNNHTHTLNGATVPALSIPAIAIPSLSVPALTINNDGGGAAHNNMPPYQATNFVIKY